MSDIPVHRLGDEHKYGIAVYRFTYPYSKEDTIGVHRDDHYIFLMLEDGAYQMMVDFITVESSGGSIFYVLPGQVHHGLAAKDATGWLVAVDTSLVPDEYRRVFEAALPVQTPLPLTAALQNELTHCLSLLNCRYHQPADSPFYPQLLHAATHTLTGIFAAAYTTQELTTEAANARPQAITHLFKSQLIQHFRAQKSPAAYAEMQHLSLSYLNECVKSVSGFSVTYWIQYEIMLEAKRLLYYTEKSIKEVAVELGYEDHAYFSRLFTKATGIPAGQFRRQYRESSN